MRWLPPAWIALTLLLCLASAVVTSAATPTAAETTPRPLAADPLLDPQRVRFRRIGVAEGLSQRTVLDIAQDHDGFIWLGTQDGLNRFDGRSMRVYRRSQGQTGGLSGNRIQALAVDRDGVLWVGSNGGLDRYDAELDRFHAEWTPAAGDRNVFDLVVDAAGGLWVAAASGLMQRPSAGSEWNRLAVDPNDPEALPAAPSVLHADPAGPIWIGTAAGVRRYQPGSGRLERLPTADAAAVAALKLPVTALLLDRQGRLWIGSESQGLVRYDPAQGSTITLRHSPHQPASLLSDAIYSVMQHRNGSVLVGTLIGVSLLDPEHPDRPMRHWQHRRHDPHSLGAASIAALFEDRRGNTWISTWGDGISLLPAQPPDFLSFNGDSLATPGLQDAYVISLHADRNRWLLGTRDGLFRFDADTLGLTELAGGQGALVYAMLRRPDGSQWLATRHGVRQLRDGRLQSLPAGVAEELQQQQAYALFDDDRRLWVGCVSGDLYQLDPVQPRLLSSRKGLGWISFIEPLDSATMLVGSSNGLYWFDRQTGELRYQHGFGEGADALPAADLTDFLRGRDGRLWLTSFGAGLIELQLADAVEPSRASFRSYGSAQGLANESLTALFEDRQGRLWLASNRGISRFDPGQARFRNYDSTEGLFSNGYYDNAAAQLADGRIAFGGPQGITVFDPDRIETAEPPPPPLLIDVMVAHHRLTVNGNGLTSPLDRAPPRLHRLRLHAAQARQLSFGFAAVDSIGESVRYAYRLHGFDLDWVHSDVPAASYTNLAAGSYRLHMRAINADGVLGAEARPLPIEIAPYWWDTATARAAVVALLALLLGLSFRWRVANLERRRAQLEVLVNERTAELQASIAREREQERLLVREKLATASQLTGGLAHEINNPTHFAALAAQNLQAEHERFRQFLIELAGADAEPEVLAAFDQRFDRLGEQLQIILEGNQRVAGIVADLRAFSKLDPPEPKPTPIGELLAATVRLAGARYRQRIDFELDLAADPPILCLPARLNQVFMNLVINACHAIEERSQREGGEFRGRIRVSSSLDPAPTLDHPGLRTAASIRATEAEHETVARMQRSEIREGAAPPSERGHLVISVEDNGGGIPAELQARIFEPFFTTKPEGVGTGLGLAVSRGIVEEHGGRIEVHTAPGSGSRFVVHLPLASPDAEVAA